MYIFGVKFISCTVSILYIYFLFNMHMGSFLKDIIYSFMFFHVHNVLSFELQVELKLLCLYNLLFCISLVYFFSSSLWFNGNQNLAYWSLKLINQMINQLIHSFMFRKGAKRWRRGAYEQPGGCGIDVITLT